MIPRLAQIACILTLAATPALAADPVLGTWQTQPGDEGHFGFVTMAPCGSKICGTLSRAFDATGKPIPSDTVGRQIVWDMQPEGAGKYASGRIWAPDRDKTYTSKMEIAGDRLKVYGCVFGICRSQTWSRVR
ncbi:imidazoleglycerol-phosphate dehydratase [Salipiger sp. CCB-MM3]|uniref:DUF2147 domain-containing protein n=1 Tax=Salipiger sp. CCB-MM3 TaxID=1792508 RepID=UPI00080ABF56|nr:DUF2147 domain-containing protein [Salipiger sp. CCB-MM3]ANT60880.1 imidazoleglycerol-phosphate dehydratase [Salipiger sp. CCB-MM3]